MTARCDAPEVYQLFCRMAVIDAPSLAENELAEWLKNWFVGMELHLEEDDAAEGISGTCGNLLCRVEGSLSGPPLLFGVHLDTVEPCHGKRPILDADGTIHSDGTTILGADDLAGVAAILAALKRLRRQGVQHRSLELLFTVAEELHLLGSSRIKPDWLNAREAYVLDTAGPPGLAVHQAPGHIALEFDITGQAAHAGIAPEQGVSAVQTAAKAIAAMRLGRVDPDTTANIGVIEGGSATNVVAGHCRFTAECRSHNPGMLQEQADHMIDCVKHSCKETGASCRWTDRVSYQPFRTSADRPVVERMRQACASAALVFQMVRGGGGSDMNHLSRFGMEGLVLATGMEQVHTCQESLQLSHLIELERLVFELMIRP